MTYSRADIGLKIVDLNSQAIPVTDMAAFDSSNFYNSQISPETLDEKTFNTKKSLFSQTDFRVFPNWSSESETGDESWLDDEHLADELAQLFIREEILDDNQLADELASLEQYLLESQTALVACPKNMPPWENAWWGEKVLKELEA
ncbi:hypothetical protein [Allocoleopsis franciscana]|uniref:Uncharacterized protein n=1 Tax=Allocoleopsis franciscana PCC 7113 TaxID=1173027 RepID=K9WB98_9CYAN|nr:hypothetical protein [Allocoleopsis franciscana]AFZ17049.1 hypothetical protein Mic7113_1158 [Allocoleopsis franciscana PCC 7113]